MTGGSSAGEFPTPPQPFQQAKSPLDQVAIDLRSVLDSLFAFVGVLTLDGTLIAANGQTTALKFDEFELTPLREWRSSSGATYPIEWRVQLPARGVDLTVRAALENQEMRTEGSTGVSYWEGSITVQGSAQGQMVRGRGYLEMTGYAGVAMGAVMR